MEVHTGLCSEVEAVVAAAAAAADRRWKAESHLRRACWKAWQKSLVGQGVECRVGSAPAPYGYVGAVVAGERPGGSMDGAGLAEEDAARRRTFEGMKAAVAGSGMASQQGMYDVFDGWLPLEAVSSPFCSSDADGSNSPRQQFQALLK